VLLGDGRGGVIFLVSSRSICSLVTTTMGWYFLWGPFRGGIFFGVRSEGIFLCLLLGLLLEEREVSVMSFQKYPSNAVIYLASQPYLQRDEVVRSGPA
jgi:hypothetical protein